MTPATRTTRNSGRVRHCLSIGSPAGSSSSAAHLTGLAAGTIDSVAFGDPFEFIAIECGAPFGQRCTGFLMIVNHAGPNPKRFKYLLFGDPGTTVSPALNAGTIFGHPNALGAVAVGAAF